jgi:phosphotriesterase-related protein
MDRNALRGEVQTVLGPIEPDRLGSTLMHEHLIVDLVPPSLACCAPPAPEPEITLATRWRINYGRVRHDGRFRLNEVDGAVSELREMRRVGGHGLVELTNGGIKPNPEALVMISKRTEVHIVMGCGYYVDEYQDDATRFRSVDDLAGEIVGQIREGAWGTAIRAGIIGEIGCQWPWTEFEKRVMHAAVAAQQETGASITVHPGRDPDHPSQVVDFISRAGGDVTRTIIGHIDRTIFDAHRLERLADSGCVIEYDFFGWESTYYPLSDVDLPNDGMRLKWIRRLIDRGHLSQIVISHDICQKTRLVRYGGHGYGHIFENVVPMARSRGFTEDELDAILVRNPRRLLTLA